MTKALTPQEMQEILAQFERAAGKGPGTPLGESVARALIAGTGVCMVVTTSAWLLQAPPDVLTQLAASAWTVASGIGLALHIIPENKRRNLELLRRFDATARSESVKKGLAYEAIQRLERTVTDQRNEIATLKAQARAVPIAPSYSENFTPAADVANENVTNAETILRYWFDTVTRQADGTYRGKWYSRPIAEQAGWMQSEHAAAVQLLDDAGMLGRNGKFPFVLPQFDGYEAAALHLNNFCERMRREPELPKSQMVMSNDLEW